MEEIRCKTTFDGLESWLKSYMTTRGYQRYEVGRADAWRVESGGWAEGISYIGPSRRAEVRIRITTLEPELIAVTGEVAFRSSQEAIDPRDQAELETVMDAIRTKCADRQPVKRKNSIAPNRAELYRWKAVWREIQPYLLDGRNKAWILDKLQMHINTDLQCSDDTLTRIIKAGEKGELD